MRRKTNDYFLDKIDNRLSKLISEYKQTKLSDENFSKTKFKDALFIQKIIFLWTWKKSYDDLTNYNYHFLVKILNYNWYFKWDLWEDLSRELKRFKLI